MALCLQCLQHAEHTAKQVDAVGELTVMVSIALAQLRVFFRGHVWGCVRQGLHQAHADDVRSVLVAGFVAAHIHHRRLDAAGDDGGGVEQRAVPVEGNQVKLAGIWRHGHLMGIDRVNKHVQFGWQLSVQFHPFARGWVAQLQAPSVQKHALQGDSLFC